MKVGNVQAIHTGLGLIDVHAAVIPARAYSPGVHVYYQATVLRINDGLSKLKDAPGPKAKPQKIHRSSGAFSVWS